MKKTEEDRCPAAREDQPLLRVRGLTKHFPVLSRGLVRRVTGQVRALEDVSFDLRRGETLGLVGESGSGKTTCVRALLRAIEPTRGRALFASRGGEVDLASLPARRLKPLRREMQMIFQDPFSSLNPRMTVGDIVAEPLVIHGLARGADLRERVAAMLVRVGLKPEYAVRHPHAFSGGQRQRIGIARALILGPSLIVADEAVSALDVSVQAQILNLLRDLQAEMGLTCIFVSHDLGVVRHACDHVAVMYAGRIVEMAPAAELFAAPRHPYTQALLAAAPDPDPDVPLARPVAGEPCDLANPPSGCAFHPRCPKRFAPCDRDQPALRAPDGGAHGVACHLFDGPR
jgi:oligopeptide/dipeptide ABC transporter ATP-binding protein